MQGLSRKLSENMTWKTKIYPRITYSSNKRGLRTAIKQDKCKFALEISHNLIRRIGTTISQSPVSLYDNGHLISCFVQSILLFKISNIINVAVKQAEDVIHNRKQPANMGKEK